MSGETDQQRALREARERAGWRDVHVPAFGNDPASVGGTVKKRCVTDPEFAEQVRAMWSNMAIDDEATSFLAGVRFAVGYVECGSNLFTSDLGELDFEEAQERADAQIYYGARTLPQPIRDALANPNRVAE